MNKFIRKGRVLSLKPKGRPRKWKFVRAFQLETQSLLFDWPQGPITLRRNPVTSVRQLKLSPVWCFGGRKSQRRSKPPGSSMFDDPSGTVFCFSFHHDKAAFSSSSSVKLRYSNSNWHLQTFIINTFYKDIECIARGRLCEALDFRETKSSSRPIAQVFFIKSGQIRSNTACGCMTFSKLYLQQN